MPLPVICTVLLEADEGFVKAKGNLRYGRSMQLKEKTTTRAVQARQAPQPVKRPHYDEITEMVLEDDAFRKAVGNWARKIFSHYFSATEQQYESELEHEQQMLNAGPGVYTRVETGGEYELTLGESPRRT
jgi:hypothetical protein